MDIRWIGEHQTIAYAASELAEYLARMTGSQVSSAPRSAYRASDAGIWVGVGSVFPGISLAKVKDTRYDDAIFISVKGGSGIVAGNNPRSVLLAVYRLLTEMGCRWVRPGRDGEYVPRGDVAKRTITVSEAASYRHRGICIEGAVSYEHVRNMVEWAPRVGFNAYFIQFREGYVFFDRWYSHAGNPLKKPEGFSLAQARDFVSRLSKEIRKRDLVYHAVGHGWTCESLGIPGLGWDYPVPKLPEGVEKYFALVNGKREVWPGGPLNTNLCYSNPSVQSLVTKEVSRYAEEHPEIDVLHFWLADGSNNNCECDECRKVRPSDLYVKMLNQIDRLLTEKGLQTRIVFLIYVDLLWPPEQERIENPDRFILMFAPITRTYSATFAARKAPAPLSPFERNRLVFPRGVEENVSFLRAWKDRFPGDSFDFDYHFMWDHLNDPGYVAMARVLHKDVRLLRGLGLEGFMSCQAQRTFLPTGLGMTILGRTLWNSGTGFDAIADDYFAAAFGPEWKACRKYLERLSELFQPEYLRGERTGSEIAAADSFQKIPVVIEELRPRIRKNSGLTDPCWSASWKYLGLHADIVELLAQALEHKARGNKSDSLKLWEQTRRMAWEREDDLHPVLDTWLFSLVFDQKLGGK